MGQVTTNGTAKSVSGRYSFFLGCFLNPSQQWKVGHLPHPLLEACNRVQPFAKESHRVTLSVHLDEIGRGQGGMAVHPVHLEHPSESPIQVKGKDNSPFSS